LVAALIRTAKLPALLLARLALTGLLAGLLSLLTLLSLPSLLTLLSLLSLLTLLPLLSGLLSLLSGLLAFLTLLALLTPGLIAGGLLHALAHAFYLCQRFFKIAIGPFSWLRSGAHGGLSLMDLFIEAVKPLGGGRFANPGLRAQTLTQHIGGFAHAQLKLVLLGFPERLPKLRGYSRLGVGKLAGVIAHLLLQALELLRHFFFFTGHGLRLLLAGAGLR
jgi:hypothetical protein